MTDIYESRRLSGIEMAFAGGPYRYAYSVWGDGYVYRGRMNVNDLSHTIGLKYPKDVTSHPKNLKTVLNWYRDEV